MKKTIIALAALAGMASAADRIDLVYTPFDSADNWTFQCLRNGGAANYATVEDSTFFSANPNWTRPVGKYTLDTPIILKEAEDSLTFSFTLTGAVGNSVATLTLAGTDDDGARALVMGETYKGTDGASNTNFLFGTVAANTGDAYLLGSSEGWGGNTYNIKSANCVTLGALSSAATTFEGSIKWDNHDEGFVFTLTQGDKTITQFLGSTYTLNNVTIALDGKNNTLSPVFSNFTMTANIPEPATATLSLLALAGLAARRRRH